MSASRAAAIDAGSNTILLVAGHLDPSKPAGYQVIAEEIEFARLGEGVDKTGRLSDAAMERGLAAFLRYAELCHDHLHITHIVSSGTSAIRDASNGREFLTRVKEATGIDVSIIDGVREAKLGFASATDELADGTPAVVLDVGGGSAQLMSGYARRGVTGAVSFQLGAVRLTERHVKNDPPLPGELAKIEADIAEGFARGSVSKPGEGAPDAPAGAAAPRGAPLADARQGTAEVIGVSGTCTTLAAVSLGMREYDSAKIHGHVLTRGEIERLQHAFLATNTKGRSEMPGLHPKRADVIIAGTAVVLATLERYKRDRLLIADRGIRHALLREALFPPGN